MNKKELYQRFLIETQTDIKEYHDHLYMNWLEELVVKLSNK